MVTGNPQLWIYTTMLIQMTALTKSIQVVGQMVKYEE